MAQGFLFPVVRSPVSRVSGLAGAYTAAPSGVRSTMSSTVPPLAWMLWYFCRGCQSLLRNARLRGICRLDGPCTPPRPRSRNPRAPSRPISLRGWLPPSPFWRCVLWCWVARLKIFRRKRPKLTATAPSSGILLSVPNSHPFLYYYSCFSMSCQILPCLPSAWLLPTLQLPDRLSQNTFTPAAVPTPQAVTSRGQAAFRQPSAPESAPHLPRRVRLPGQHGRNFADPAHPALQWSLPTATIRMQWDSASGGTVGFSPSPCPSSAGPMPINCANVNLNLNRS